MNLVTVERVCVLILQGLRREGSLRLDHFMGANLADAAELGVVLGLGDCMNRGLVSGHALALYPQSAFLIATQALVSRGLVTARATDGGTTLELADAGWRLKSPLGFRLD